MSSNRSLALKFQALAEAPEAVALEVLLPTPIVALLFRHCFLLPTSLFAAGAADVRGRVEARSEPEWRDWGPECVREVERFVKSELSGGDVRDDVEFAIGGELVVERIPAGSGGTGGMSLMSFALSLAVSIDVFLVAAVVGLGVIVPSVAASLSIARKSSSPTPEVSRTWPLLGVPALGVPLLAGIAKLESLPS
jgi:hypothetical protein